MWIISEYAVIPQRIDKLQMELPTSHNRTSGQLSVLRRFQALATESFRMRRHSGAIIFTPRLASVNAARLVATFRRHCALSSRRRQ
jgi:hypothetical protein